MAGKVGAWLGGSGEAGWTGSASPALCVETGAGRGRGASRSPPRASASLAGSLGCTNGPCGEAMVRLGDSEWSGPAGRAASDARPRAVKASARAVGRRRAGREGTSRHIRASEQRAAHTGH